MKVSIAGGEISLNSSYFDMAQEIKIEDVSLLLNTGSDSQLNSTIASVVEVLDDDEIEVVDLSKDVEEEEEKEGTPLNDSTIVFDFNDLTCDNPSSIFGELLLLLF
jgi:hypothetical protein